MTKQLPTNWPDLTAVKNTMGYRVLQEGYRYSDEELDAILKALIRMAVQDQTEYFLIPMNEVVADVIKQVKPSKKKKNRKVSE